MTAQKFYTPEKAASEIGCSVADVLENIKVGRLRGHFMDNTGNYVIAHDDLVTFLRITQQFKAVTKLNSCRLFLVDRDSDVQDIMKMELGREGVDIKVATSDGEVGLLAGDFQPDIICIHLGATMREKGAVKSGLDRARTASKSYLILYHHRSRQMQETDEFKAQVSLVKPDEVVFMDRGVTPLVDAVRRRLGLKPSRPTIRRPLDP